MRALWGDFEKQLWKNRQIENNLHDTLCAGFTGKPWCRCKTSQQEMADWDAFVLANYTPPLEVVKPTWGTDE